MQGLPLELDAPSFPPGVHIQALTHKVVPVQSGLQPDLIALTCHQGHLDQRGLAKFLEHSVTADRFRRFGFARVRRFLQQQLRIPRDSIAPCSPWRREVTVHDREVHALRLVSPELILQPQLYVSSLREDNEPRRITIDPVYDKRPTLSARSQVLDEFVFDRRSLAAAGQRNTQQPGGLVDHNQHIVLVDDAQLAFFRATRTAPMRGTRTIDPDSHAIAIVQAPTAVFECRFDLVHEYFPAFERNGCAASRSKPVLACEKFVEPDARILSTDDEWRITHVFMVPPCSGDLGCSVI